MDLVQELQHYIFIYVKDLAYLTQERSRTRRKSALCEEGCSLQTFTRNIDLLDLFIVMLIVYFITHKYLMKPLHTPIIIYLNIK